MTDDTPTVTSTAAEASTAAPPDPRAIMAAMGVSCATCRWWYQLQTMSKWRDGHCMGTPRGDHITPWGHNTAMALGALLTRPDHFCAMWERQP